MTKRYLYVTEDTDWKHLMHDWFYTLWHNKEIRICLHKLSRGYDIFYCFVGDSDESYGFTYFKDGDLRRKCIAMDEKLQRI